MKLTHISYEDLMKILHYEDKSEFRKTLRRLNVQLSSRKPVERNKADEISYMLFGRKINWEELETENRSITYVENLEKGINAEQRELINQWYDKIKNLTDTNGKNIFLALVCAGGFLEGEQEQEFILTLTTGINLIIGERGSGKSTILNLLSMQANSVEHETKALVEKIFKILNPETNNELDEITLLIKKVITTMRNYGVEKVTIFYIHNSSIHCFFIDNEENNYEILRKNEQNIWISVDSQNYIQPSILFFPQGEIFRIAEEDEESYYLNSIMDSIFPELYVKRVNLTTTARKIVTQFENTKINYFQNRFNDIDRFVNIKFSELDQLKVEFSRRTFNISHVEQIQSYLDNHDDYLYDNPEISIMTEPISKLLKRGDEISYVLYLSRISRFLRESLGELREIDNLRKSKFNLNRNQQNEISDYHEIGNNYKQHVKLVGVDEIEEEFINEFDNINSTERNKNGVFINDHNKKLDNNEEKNKRNQKITNSLEENNSQSPQEKSENEIFSDENLWNTTIEKILEFLRTRLVVLRRWIRLFSKRRIIYDKSIRSLINNYVDFLKMRKNLITQQVDKCQQITTTLEKDEAFITVFTIDAENEIAKCDDSIEKITNLKKLYDTVFQANQNIDNKELSDNANLYDMQINDFIEELKKIRTEQSNEFSKSLIFNPIGIKLRQGNIYRDFKYLSFGQKSGIILKMVLSTTDKRIIIIDQPEDNLDAFSIVNMLAPTLEKIGKEKQLILVTHNSNLVISLEEANMIVLKSFGAAGRLHSTGSITEKQIVNEMIDILEGGPVSFERKLLNYEHFFDRIKGMIPEIDIAYIEGSYRRRTIDSLSNYLQPIVSDKSALARARHELKQLDAAKLRLDILDLQKVIMTKENQEVLTNIDKLCKDLDIHVNRFLKTIAEIRMMDTNPKPEYIRIYNALILLQEEYSKRMEDGHRNLVIDIDSKLSDVSIWFDKNHFQLIFRNLIENALRATELRYIDFQLAKIKENPRELIRISLSEVCDEVLHVEFFDNGRGLKNEIRQKIYKERCSDQIGTDHGLGAVIISKLLYINGGRIEVGNSINSGNNPFTLQMIELPLLGKH